MKLCPVSYLFSHKVVMNQPFVNFTILSILQLLFRLRSFVSCGGRDRKSKKRRKEMKTMRRNYCLNYEGCSLNFPSVLFFRFVKSQRRRLEVSWLFMDEKWNLKNNFGGSKNWELTGVWNDNAVTLRRRLIQGKLIC